MITVYGDKIDIDKLRLVELIRPPKAGSVWKGIQHGEFADLIVETANGMGWEISDMQFSLSNDEADMVAAFELDKLPDLETPAGLKFAMGVVTSNARRVATRLFAGARVAICSNGLATGEVVMEKKHAKGLDLASELKESFSEYARTVARTGWVVQQMKERKLTSQEVEHIIMEAGRRKLMPWARLGFVDHEYRVPRFDEIGTGTSWALMNAYTWVVKRHPPLRQMTAMNEFRKLLPLAEIVEPATM